MRTQLCCMSAAAWFFTAQVAGGMPHAHPTMEVGPFNTQAECQQRLTKTPQVAGPCFQPQPASAQAPLSAGTARTGRYLGLAPNQPAAQR